MFRNPNTYINNIIQRLENKNQNFIERYKQHIKNDADLIKAIGRAKSYSQESKFCPECFSIKNECHELYSIPNNGNANFDLLKCDSCHETYQIENPGYALFK